MINETRTLKDFEYTSDTLTSGSNKRVWRVCEGCGKEEEILYQNYSRGTKMCRRCAQLNRGPFDVEYFQSVQKSINDGYVNEFRTFDTFGYYSIDLLYSSNEKVWRICRMCKDETKVVHSKHIRGQIICKSCIHKRENLSDHTLEKMIESHKRENLSDTTLGKMVESHKRENLSDTTLEKISGKNNYNFGKHLTEETKRKISESNTGRHHSKETLEKMSANRPDMFGKNNPFYGKRHTYETRKQISIIKRGILYEEWDNFVEDLYPIEFSKDLRNFVRKSTNDCDFLTGIHKNVCNNCEELSVHHIDYNKSNNNIKNLVPLSRSNHARTNTDREFWQTLFNEILYIDDEYPDLNTLLAIKSEEN